MPVPIKGYIDDVCNRTLEPQNDLWTIVNVIHFVRYEWIYPGNQSLYLIKHIPRG